MSDNVIAFPARPERHIFREHLRTRLQSVDALTPDERRTIEDAAVAYFDSEFPRDNPAIVSPGLSAETVEIIQNAAREVHAATVSRALWRLVEAYVFFFTNR